MNQHKKTDRIIKDKMGQHSMEAPMHLFDNIADALDKDAAVAVVPQQKWRNGYRLLGLLLLVVLAGGGVWYTWSNNDALNSAEGGLSVLPTENTSTLAASKKGNEENIVAPKNTQNAKDEFFGKGNTVNSNQKASTELAIVSTATKQNEKKISKNKSASNREKFLGENDFSNSSVQNVFEKNKKQQDELIVKGESEEQDFVEQKERPSVLDGNYNLSDSQTGNVNTTSKNTVLELEKTNAAVSKREVSVLDLPQNNSNNNLFQRKSDYKLDIEPKCGIKPDGSKIKFTTSVDLFFSPDYAQQILEYKDTDFEEHARMRTESENPYYSFNTGMRVNFLTEYGWAVRTGLVYTQINEILKTQHLEISLSIDVTTGDTLGYTEGIRDVNIRNQYKMIDIPLIIGYEFPMKKFDLNINGGVYFNLMSKQSGAFFSPLEDKIVYFTEGHPDDFDIFKNNIGLSIFLGLGFNYELNKKTKLIIEPHVRYYPKSFTLDNYILNQKYFSTGVMIGVRRDL